MAFALLSCLRYLNLKNNSLTVFPDVVSSITILIGCNLPTIDTAYYQAHYHALA